MKFFTSDWHIGHQNVLKIGRGRPFSDLKEMEDVFVREHNRRVKPKDEVYHLGDFAYKTSKQEAKRVLARLNGTHYICVGNHDFTSAELFEIGFKDVFENRWIWLCDYKTGKKWKVYLSHYPYFPSIWYRIKCALKGWHYDNRYLHKRIVNVGGWLLCGHSHQAKPVYGKTRQINVGVDANSWMPISENQIVATILEMEAKENWLDKLILKFKARYL